LTGALLAATFADGAYANDRNKNSRQRIEPRQDSRDRVAIRREPDRDDRRSQGNRQDARRDDRRDDRRDSRASDRYFRDRDVIVVREYYRPYYRPLPRGVRYHYVRHGHLPRGWERKMRPVPVYIARDLHPIPHGYSRGIIDGHLVVHNSRGLIVDVAVLF
jgi:hypothetical protein